MKKIILALRHFRVTLICLFVVGVFVVFFRVNTLWSYLLAVLLALIQPFIDKVREIERELENEPKMPTKAPTTSNIEIDLWGFISRTKKPVLVFGSVLLLAVVVVFIYLYFNF